jgi:CRISPR-associated protein Csm1
MNYADFLSRSEDRVNAGCQIALLGLLRSLNQFSQSSKVTTDSVALMVNRIKSGIEKIIDVATETHQEWIMTVAEQMACGVKNTGRKQIVAGQSCNSSTRLQTLFERIRLSDAKTAAVPHRYPLAAMTPMMLFPMPATGSKAHHAETAQQEYVQLWDGFEHALADIPAVHRHSLPLWLDHFETLWTCYTASIPSMAASDVSLYDYSKTVAALAVALWRYHHDMQHQPDADWIQPKFLLIQGDCFGIQDFIFATEGETQKRAAKLLRGRSFYVSLLSECAALRVLEALDLPGTSQMINAAGKLLIIAANTPETITKLTAVQQQLDEWFLRHTWGQSGIGLAWIPACGNDFLNDAGGKKPLQI